MRLGCNLIYRNIIIYIIQKCKIGNQCFSCCYRELLKHDIFLWFPNNFESFECSLFNPYTGLLKCVIEGIKWSFPNLTSTRSNKSDFSKFFKSNRDQKNWSSEFGCKLTSKIKVFLWYCKSFLIKALHIMNITNIWHILKLNLRIHNIVRSKDWKCRIFTSWNINFSLKIWWIWDFEHYSHIMK